MVQMAAEETLLAQARRDLDGWASGDPTRYADSAAPGVTYFHNVPALPRIDGAEAFRGFLTSLKGQIPPHDYRIVAPKVQICDTVGIFNLQYHAYSADGEPLVKGRGTCVYREVGGSWRLIHAHWSGLDEA